MTFRGERAVSDLCSLKGNNHVSSRSQHRKVTSNSGREGHLQPVVRTCVWEGSGKHLANGHVGGNVGKDGDNHDEPVDAKSLCHLLGALAHEQVEETLWDTSVVERSDKKELANEKHEKTVIHFSEGGFGLSDEFLLFRLDFIAVHVVRLLWWKWVSSVEQKARGFVRDSLTIGKDSDNGSNELTRHRIEC